MTRLASILLLLALGCGTVREASLFDRAMARRGGRETLRATAGLVRSSRGSLRGLAYSSVTTYRHPNMLRLRIEFEGSDTPIEQVFDGNIGYQQMGDRMQRLEPPEARIIRNRCLDESVFWLLVLEDPNLTIAELGPAEFLGQPAEALRVEHWSGYSRDLFFDSGNSDLLGSQGMTWTAMGRVMTTIVYSDYQQMQGLRLPMSQETLIDGQPFSNEEHASIRLVDIPDLGDFLFH